MLFCFVFVVLLATSWFTQVPQRTYHNTCWTAPGKIIVRNRAKSPTTKMVTTLHTMYFDSSSQRICSYGSIANKSPFDELTAWRRNGGKSLTEPMPGTFFLPPLTSKETANLRSRHAAWHVGDARALMHVGIDKPRWRGKRSRYSRRMRNQQFYASGKRPMHCLHMQLHVF